MEESGDFLNVREQLADSALRAYISSDASGDNFWSNEKNMADACAQAMKWADVFLKARAETEQR